MPRLLLERRYWQRVREHQRLLGLGVKTAWRTATSPPFIDYWPGIPGTIPEKMVFNELVKREINFYDQTSSCRIIT
jgi:hypothetical protein